MNAVMCYNTDPQAKADLKQIEKPRAQNLPLAKISAWGARCAPTLFLKG